MPELVLRFGGSSNQPGPTAGLPRGQVTLLEMTSGFQALRHRLVLDCAATGAQVLHLVSAAQGAVMPGDGPPRGVSIGHHLDSTQLAREAQAEGLDPAYVLASSIVARAFTAYQLSVLVQETLTSELREREHLALIVVSDPLALYTEEDVPRQEGLVLAEQTATTLQAVARDHDVPVLVVQPPMGGPRFIQPVRAAADRWLRVAKGPGGQHVLERPAQGTTTPILQPTWGQATLEAFGLEAGSRPVADPSDALDHRRLTPLAKDPCWQPAPKTIVEVAGGG